MKRVNKRRGPISDEEWIDRALERPVRGQIERTAKVAFAQIERLIAAGEEIPMSLIGIARMCTEWHTDVLTVQAALQAAQAPERPLEDGDEVDDE